MITKESTSKANLVSLKQFMNSFVRDYSNDKRVSVMNSQIRVVVDDGILEIPLLQQSVLGVHEYLGYVYLNTVDLSVESLAQIIFRNFSSFDSLNKENDFVKKVQNSHENIKLFIERAKEISSESYLDSEQQLLFGHPFHPYSKAKWGMSHEDMNIYAPELQGSFKLVWLELEEFIINTNATQQTLKSITRELAEFDLKKQSKNIFLPMHPWQWNRIKNKVNPLGIINVFEGRNFFSPLSSMRTLYNEDSPYQLKFSLDLTLTNSIRHLQPEECSRGAQIENILREEKVAQNIKNFKVQYESVFINLKASDGKDIVESVVQFRENVDKKTLKDSRLLSYIYESMPVDVKLSDQTFWFSAFLNNVIKPFLVLQSRYGVLLGAHMQNIIVTFKGGLPSGVIFRDCQGTGFTEKAQKRYSAKYAYLEADSKNILNCADVNKVFGYYLIVNTVFSVMAALARSNKNHETQHLYTFRSFLHDLKSELVLTNDADIDFIDYVLNSETLFQKGNMRCSLMNINENTIQNPWEIYNEMPNPLKGLRPVVKNSHGLLYTAKNSKKRTLSFRRFESRDMDVFYSWQHKAHVSKFWEMAHSKPKLQEYINGVLNSSHKDALIFEVDSKPVGYFESYWACEDRIAPYCSASVYDRGIHLLIGDEKFLSTSVVLDSIFHVTKFLLEDHPLTQRVWGEPRSDNQSIKVIAQKLPGWRVLDNFKFPHKTATLLECDKKRFLEESHEYLL